MHKNPLIQFIQEKMNEAPAVTKTGPIVTISREFGCPGNDLGNKIAETLAARQTGQSSLEPWRALNKEIMAEAAQQVDLTPELVEKVFNQKQTSIFKDLFQTFSDHYTPSDVQVKKAVAGVIRTMARNGRVILIGRGSVSLTQDIDEAIHVQVYAPLKWRIEQVKARFHLKEEDARKKLEQIDFERTYLRNFYAGKTTDDSLYDLKFNAARSSIDEMAETIIRLMEKRNYLAG